MSQAVNDINDLDCVKISRAYLKHMFAICFISRKHVGFSDIDTGLVTDNHCTQTETAPSWLCQKRRAPTVDRSKQRKSSGWLK